MPLLLGLPRFRGDDAGEGLLEQHSDRSEPLPRPRGKFSSLQLRDVIEYIHTNLSEELSLTELAEHLNLSAFYFARLMNCSALLREDGVSKTPLTNRESLLTLRLDNLPSESGEAHWVEVPYLRLMTPVPDAIEPIFSWLRYKVGLWWLSTKLRGLISGYWALLHVSVWVRQLPTGYPATLLCTGCRPHALSGFITLLPRFKYNLLPLLYCQSLPPLTPPCLQPIHYPHLS